MKKINDPAYLKAMRSDFKILRRTPEFRRWRKTQLWIQKRQCAWCCQRIPKGSKNVYVAHALLVLHGGTHDYDNLVIAHINYDAKKKFKPGQVPQWIRDNKRKYELDILRREQQRVFDEYVERHEQEKLGNWISEII